MRLHAKIKRYIRWVVLHGVLVAGAVVFSMPFAWLLSGSCKVTDEMYPPKWLPQVPGNVIEGPYIDLRRNEFAEKPARVHEDDWKRVRGPILDALTEEAVVHVDGLPEFYRPYLHERLLAEAIFRRLAPRAPDELFSKTTGFVAAWFADRVDTALIRESFESVYRRIAVSHVTLHGWDVVRVENPAAEINLPWEVVSGEARLIARKTGLLRSAKEVHYSFARHNRLTLGVTVPMEMPPEDLKKVVVGVHGDRSWHEVRAVIELAGRRYEAIQPTFLRSDGWQDITWQVPSKDDRSLQIKTWTRLGEASPSDFDEPGVVRVQLEVTYRPRFMAAFNKFANSYRECLRSVPLLCYIKNSLLLVALNIAGQIIGSSLVAFAFARLRWPGRDFCFLILLATLMIPPQVTMVPVFLIVKTIGWYNTLRPLWVPAFFGSPFFIFLLRQFMRTIPTDLEDSAKIDGCGYLGIYARVILPLIKPALAAIAIFTFMGVWNDFMGPLIYLTDQELYPLSLGLFALKVLAEAKAIQGTGGLMMAASALMTLPVIILFFLAQRHFIQGVTLTGMKG